MKNLFHCFIVTLGAVALTGCSTVKVVDQQTYSPVPARPQIIYVANFDLQTKDIHSETGGPLGIHIAPIHRVRELLNGNSSDPEVLAAKLVNYMADSIVKDLQKDGFTAQRIDPDSAVPTNGWLVRGVFAQVDEGNRLRRALIGFGAGKTDLQVVTTMDNLADGPPQPLYQVKTEATSGDAPGAGPMIAIMPASAAVSFIRAGGDVKRNVSETAAKIASQVTEQFKAK